MKAQPQQHHMADGFTGDIEAERRFVSLSLIGGIALIALGLDALGLLEEWGFAERGDWFLDLIALIGFAFVAVANVVVVLSSVVISVRRNELVWTFFILTLGGAWFYYLLDWFSDNRGE